MGNIGSAELLILVITSSILAFPFWKIFGKAGFRPALSLLMLIPLVNVMMLFFLAFSEWPSLKQNPK